MLLLTAAGLLASCGSGQSSSNGIQAGGNGRVINNGQGSGFDAGSPPDSGSADGPLSVVGAACAACETQKCDPGPAYGASAGDGGLPDGGLNEAGVSFVENIAGYADFYGSCYRAVGNAKTGRAAGQPLAQLCIAVLSCVHRTGCGVAADGTFTGESCYCGAGVDSVTCASDATGAKAKGKCKTEIENAAESVNPLVIGMEQGDSSSAYGAAMGLVYWCDSKDPFTNGTQQGSIADSPCGSFCAGQQSFGGSSGSGTGGSGGESNAGGGGGHGGAGGVAATGGNGVPQNTGGAAGQQQPVPELSAACATCELDPSGTLLDYGSACYPPYLGVQVDDSGLPVAGAKFGCASLGAVAARDACNKLIACIGAHSCSTNSTGTMPGDNPVEGCYCGPAPETSANCLTGMGITGPCVAAYHEAALTDSSAGLTAASAEGNFALYVGTAAYDPTTAVGMADNVALCAIDQPCMTCFDLVTPAPTGGGGGGGHSAGSGGAAGHTGGASGSGGAVTATGGTGGVGGGMSATGGIGGAGASGGSGGGGGHAIGGAGGVAGGGGQALAGSGGGGTGGSVVAVCPDLNHDTIGDCTETLVANADFKQTTTEWTPDTNATIEWTALNGTPGTGSGSIEVDNGGTTATDTSGFSREGAWQCVPVSESLNYLIAVQAYMPGGQGSGWAEFDLRFYSMTNCAGADVGRDFVSPQGLATDSWMTLTGTTQIPLGIKSAALRLVAVKPAASAPLKVDFDNALFIAD